MIRALLLVVLATPELFAQVPPMNEFYPAKLIKIYAAPGYFYYTFDTAEDNYGSRSALQLRLTEGSQVKIKLTGKFLYLIDEDGKIQQTELQVQGLKPPPPPPKKR
jgi:hypothetical protein